MLVLLQTMAYDGGSVADFGISSWFCCVQTMTEMNKVMDPQKTMQIMKEFEKESTKMGMSEEMSK